MTHKERLIGYFYKNLLSCLWSFFLVVGGGTFVAYFFYIGYMPDLDLSSSVAIVGAAAISALFLALVMLLVLVFPGASWAATAGREAKIKALWQEEDGKPRLLGSVLWFGVPLVTFYIVGVVAFFAKLWSLLILVPVLIGSYFVAKKELGVAGLGLAVSLAFVWIAGLVSAFFAFFPFFLIYKLASAAEFQDQFNQWVVVSGVAVVVVLINLAAVAKPKDVKSLAWFLGLGAVALFVTLSHLGQYHVIPSRVVQLYKFGNIPSADVVIDIESCEVFDALDVRYQVSVSMCVISDVTILSRLGRNYYMEMSSEGGRTLRVAIPSDEVMAWSLIQTDESEGENSSEGPI